MGTEEGIRVAPRCVTCEGPINVWTEHPICDAGHAAPTSGDRIVDLRRSGTRFPDWWLADESSRGAFLDEISLNEEIHQKRLMDRLVLPLLSEKGTRVLSVGCGCGNDVEILANNGCDAWGIDLGGRAVTWPRRLHARRLLLADADRLPFADGAFDLVLGIDVLEHIGTDGDTATLLPDGWDTRTRVAAEMLRVARPGGRLLLSGPNRLFPADPFHRQMKTRLGVRWHSPRERFLLSFSDHVRLFGGGARSIEALPLDRFFSFTRARRVPGVSSVIPLLESIFRRLPGWFYRSPLNPFLVIVVTAGEDA